MNLRKAKALRRAARKATAGMPLVKYAPLVAQRIFQKGDIAGIGKSAIFMGHVKMIDQCTRFVYQAMKKGAQLSTS